jgi:hypothetical protein
VTFDIGQGPVAALTGTDGVASATIRVLGTVGTHHLTASYAGDATHLPSTAQSADFTELKAPTALGLKATSSSVRASLVGPRPKPPLINIDTGLVATLTSGGQPLPQKSVVFTLTSRAPNRTVVVSRTTDLNGEADLGVLALVPGVYTVTVEFGTSTVGTTVDPVYAAATTRPASYVLIPGHAIRI